MGAFYADLRREALHRKQVKPRIIIIIEGGIVQEVLTHGADDVKEVVVCEYVEPYESYTDGADDVVPQGDGTEAKAWVRVVEAEKANTASPSAAFLVNYPRPTPPSPLS